MKECNHILIVDDDEGIRSSLEAILTFEGYKVMEATNGKEAFDALTKLGPTQAPGLILLDLMMPIMDGKTFLKNIQLSDLEWLKALPIVVI